MYIYIILYINIQSITDQSFRREPRNFLLLGAETHWPIGEESNGHVDSRGQKQKG